MHTSLHTLATGWCAHIGLSQPICINTGCVPPAPHSEIPALIHERRCCNGPHGSPCPSAPKAPAARVTHRRNPGLDKEHGAVGRCTTGLMPHTPQGTRGVSGSAHGNNPRLSGRPPPCVLSDTRRAAIHAGSDIHIRYWLANTCRPGGAHTAEHSCVWGTTSNSAGRRPLCAVCCAHPAPPNHACTQQKCPPAIHPPT
jgi:hypothetical protein